MMVTALILQLVHAAYVKPIFLLSHSDPTSKIPNNQSKDKQSFLKYKKKIMKMTVKELRKKAGIKKVKKTGKKNLLQERLLKAYDASNTLTSSDEDDDSDLDEISADDEVNATQEAGRLQSNATPPYLLRFLKILVARSSMSNNHGADDSYRRFLSHFVMDLLRIVTRAEWPGAEKVLSILTRLLTNVTHKEVRC